MTLERITPEHYESVRLLRNNPLNKKGFIVQDDITEEQQLAYMGKHHDEYWVCTIDEDVVGYIGVINNDIRICVDPLYQRQGIAMFMVNEIKKMFPKAQAKIMQDNQKSLNLFVKAGYKIKYYLLELA